MKKIIFVLILFVIKTGFSQVGIGEWQTHLPYSKGKTIITAKNLIYCATENGLFYYNTSDNSTTTLSKTDGLSDVTISSIYYVSSKSMLIIGYANGNIDLIKDNVITNISDIKRKQIYGSKSINNIIFYNDYAYLATSFGIVKLDIDRYEIRDTYMIGENSATKQIFDIDVYNNMFYVATEDGIFTADVNSPNLAFYENWSRDINIPDPNSTYNSIAIFDNKLWVVQNNENIDKLFFINANTWSEYTIDGANEFYSLNSDSKYIYVPFDGKVMKIDKNNNETILTSYNFSWGNTWASISNSLTYNNTQYVSDKRYGIIKLENNIAISVKPNGPYSTSFWNIDIFNGKLWASVGGVNSSWNNLGNNAYTMNYDNNNWKEVQHTGTIAHDAMAVCIDRKDDKRVYVSSWNGGVFEIYDGKQVNQYLSDNSSLDFVTSTWDAIRVGGLAMDEDGNLWTSGMALNNQFNVKTTDGKWHGLAYSNITEESVIRTIMITKDNYKWVTLHRTGIFIFDDKGTYENVNDDDHKKIQVRDENGDIVSNDVFSMAEDKKGTIWVGTSKGVVTYFYPSDVFTNDAFFGQRVIIEQNGISQYLLETEEINAIAVDGANRKWFGTRSSGVYLISEDGTEELKHFTIDNSPLLDNSISSIAINDVTGDVYFGTAKGLVSYRGTATQGLELFTDVYAYPNPVPPDYTGPIAIKGLVDNADVKITDISGNLVFETKAEGGQAIWNGKNFNGEKVHTGVYMAFCSNEDGTKTHITKILFIN